MQHLKKLIPSKAVPMAKILKFNHKHCYTTVFAPLSRKPATSKINPELSLGSANAVNYPIDYKKRYRQGDKVFGFVVEEIDAVPELHLTALRFRHQETGADYLHIAREDGNNVFSVAFRTPPPDSSGMVHILEHLALCGSKKYPCRDPFFKMLSRSLSTFMNAFTTSDSVVFPFSSQNFQDFNNLMAVYLDAAFYPNLRKLDFNQEGWRFEHETLSQPQSPIVFKGVVYNEMKGVFSSSANLFMERFQNGLFPDNAYGYVSGGDPLDIPSLTWDNLKTYHTTYCQATNARFFSYGTFPVESHLANVDKWVLSKSELKNVNTSFVDQPKWSEPRRKEITCAADPLAPNPDKQTTVGVGYMLSDITDTFESFTLAILSNLLIDGASAPFYKSLIVPDIGSDYSPGVGYDSRIRQSCFTVGLTGIADDDVDRVLEIINETFDQVIREGFPSNQIEGVLHSVELNNKHQSANFGLMLNLAINPSWNQGGDPIQALQLNKNIEKFRKRLQEDSNFLQSKVKEYFKDNTHRLTLIMRPDERYSVEFAQMEMQNLKMKVEKLSEEEKRCVYEEGLALAKSQEEPVDTSCLPTLMISEVDRLVQTTHLSEHSLKDVSVTSCPAATNGVVYLRSILNAAHLPTDLLPYLPLFCSLVTRMGAGDKDYVQQDQAATLYTGGLNASLHLTQGVNTMDSWQQGVLLSSYCLEHNVEKMLSLWKDVFIRVNFEDKDRLIQLIRMEASELVQGLADRGHAYAMRRSGSSLTPVAALSEKFSGITNMFKIKKISELNDYEKIISNLKNIAESLMNRESMRCMLHATPKYTDKAVCQLEELLKDIRTKQVVGNASEYLKTQFKPDTVKTHLITPFPVNYIGRSSLAVPYGHPDFASLGILSRLISRNFLHTEIREKGGAYGSGANIGATGLWQFYSFRDPNVKETFVAFDRSLDWASNGSFTPKEVDEAKLGMFSDVDHPVAPGNKGLHYFQNGITDEMRQEYKDQLFSANRDDLVMAAEKYLKKSGPLGLALIGPANETTKLEGWNVITE